MSVLSTLYTPVSYTHLDVYKRQDLYNKKTRDALIEQKLPSTIGVGSNTYKLNKGEISNKGIELALSYRGSINHFNYLVSGNISYNKNKVLNIGNASYLSGGNFNRTLVDRCV